MSIPQKADPAKLVIGCLVNDKELVDELFPHLEKIGGPVDMISSWLTFDYTRYYEKEMGSVLYRKVFVFKHLIEQDGLAGIKLETNTVEQQFAKDGRRRVNIDPGYLLSSRFVLATGKEYSHRIYIGQDIYADLTLMYTKKNGFVSLEWTYPDYVSKEIKQFLTKVRDKYILDLRAAKGNKND